MAEKQNTTKTINSNEDLAYWVKKFWSSFLYYTRNIECDDPNNFKKTVQEAIDKEITDLTTFLTHYGSTRSDYLRANAQKFFVQNPTSFVETYKLVLENIEKDPSYFEKFTSLTYSYNKDSFRTQFLVELLRETRKANPSIEPGTKTEFSALQINLRKFDKIFEQDLKQSYIELLLYLKDFFEKFNILEPYCDTFSNKLMNYSLQELSYAAHTDKKHPKSLDTIFTEKYLNSLALPKLIAIAGFWINRATKATRTLNELNFIINEFDLWPQVKNQRKQFPLDNKQLDDVLTKTRCLYHFEDELFAIMEEIHLAKPKLNNEQLTTIFSKFFDEKVSKEQKRYKERFDDIFPDSDNNLEKELSSIHELFNTRYLLYRLKDFCIFNLIMGSIDKHYSKNWGLDSIVPGKLTQIYFDIEGLNMPLRLHVYKSQLLTCLKDYTGKSIVPIYKGAKDMTIKGDYITTEILAPILSEQNNFLNTQLADPRKLHPDILNFLRHIKFIKDPSKIPPAFKAENSNTPNAINIETEEELRILPKEMFR